MRTTERLLPFLLRKSYTWVLTFIQQRVLERNYNYKNVPAGETAKEKKEEYRLFCFNI